MSQKLKWNLVSFGSQGSTENPSISASINHIIKNYNCMIKKKYFPNIFNNEFQVHMLW